MEINDIIELPAKIREKKGTSRNGKEYRMLFLVIDTGIFGEVEILLNTKTDRAGILLDTITKT